MRDFSQTLLNKIDAIIEDWVEAVRQDREIESAHELTYKAVLDDLPSVLHSIVTILSEPEENNQSLLVKDSLEHGALRAKQGYDPEEMAREYRVLRQVIFSNLEAELINGSAKEVLRVVRAIDISVDEVIANCFKSYTEQRLEELQQIQSQLKLTNQELTRLVQTHQDNLSYLAHELKNPLTSIIGYSDLFLRLQQKNIQQKDSAVNIQQIERVLRSGRSLLHLINDALEVSRYKAGKMKLSLAATDVCAVIDSVIEILEPMAKEKGLELAISCALSSDPVITDSLRLQQVLTNLISNAIRYTETGTVKVLCQMLSDQQLAIAISDTGIGITLENQIHIFEPYYRGSKDGKYAPDSTGLGLTIVSQLVQLLQGEIKLVSEVGSGSTFTVILPLQCNTSNQ